MKLPDGGLYKQIVIHDVKVAVNRGVSDVFSARNINISHYGH